MSSRVSDSPIVESGARQPAGNKLLGVYPQKQRGLYMQRVKVPGGRISWPQWRRSARLAIAHSPGSLLHITTRQDVELHNILLEDVPAVHQGLAEAGLGVFGAGGDSLRNITVCSGCDFCRRAFDVFPLAELVRLHLERHPAILNLPRKFKISFSGCRRACARPWLSDLGFIARDSKSFTVIGAGSLGPKPNLGIRLYEHFPAEDVLALCVAALEFFEQYGDRENRRRARFRHIRERLGDEIFVKELNLVFERTNARQSRPVIAPTPAGKDIRLLHRLQLPNGNISPRAALELADAAEPQAAILRINLEHGLELYGKKPIELPDGLARLASNPVIIACPGSTTCTRALADCWAAADQIRNTLTNRQTGQLRICISGCPNNCAHSAVGDIGLVGVLRKEDARPKEHYRLLTGGGNGRNGRLAEPSSVIPAQDVSRTIESILKESG